MYSVVGMLCINGDESSWKYGYTFTPFSTYKPNISMLMGAGNQCSTKRLFCDNHSNSEWLKRNRNGNGNINWLKRKNEKYLCECALCTVVGKWVSSETMTFVPNGNLFQKDCVYVWEYYMHIQMRKLKSRTSIKVLNSHNPFSGRLFFSKSIASSKHPERVIEFSWIAMQSRALPNYCKHSPLMCVPFAYLTIRSHSARKKSKIKKKNLNFKMYNVWLWCSDKCMKLQNRKWRDICEFTRNRVYSYNWTTIGILNLYSDTYTGYKLQEWEKTRIV